MKWGVITLIHSEYIWHRVLVLFMKTSPYQKVGGLKPPLPPPQVLCPWSLPNPEGRTAGCDSKLCREDMFAVLPTGFGKSLWYACLLGVFDRLYSSRGSIVAIISPLRAIITDQVGIMSHRLSMRLGLRDRGDDGSLCIKGSPNS